MKSSLEPTAAPCEVHAPLMVSKVVMRAPQWRHSRRRTTRFAIFRV